MDPATKRPKLIHHCCVQPSQKASPNFINLRVSLSSGRCELVSLPLNDAVDDLKIAKKKRFKLRFLVLAAPDGHLLNSTESLQDPGPQDGDTISIISVVV